MKYKIKRLTMKMVRNDEIELPDGAIVIKAEFTTTFVSHGEDYRVWIIDYLEPLVKKGSELS